jgi:hypothetical protein
MCDYSLHNVASRPAEVGDRLVTTKFAQSSTRGFAALDEPNMAICLLRGTELAFEKEAEVSHPFARLFTKFRFGKLGAKVARFRQVNFHNPYMHHDALEFPNGRVVLVTELCPGQRVTVLQLPIQDGLEKSLSRHEFSAATDVIHVGA